jgi:hypothetical protein
MKRRLKRPICHSSFVIVSSFACHAVFRQLPDEGGCFVVSSFVIRHSAFVILKQIQLSAPFFGKHFLLLRG